MKKNNNLYRPQTFSASAALLLLALASSVISAPAAQPDLNLMPYPQRVSRAPGEFLLTSGLEIRTRGPQVTEVQAALQRFKQRLQKQTGLALDTADKSEAVARGQLVVELSPMATPEHAATLGQMTAEREAYELHIDTDAITIRADSRLGALHGLETLLQLIGTKPAEEISLPALTIRDAPRFRWRGLLIDSVRHFFSVDTIKRQLDGMAAAKLNIFHWHLTDDQGWRLESRHYPKLHQLASNGKYYTQKQVAEVVAYARTRGIEVVPEIDLPGHSSAIGIAYPELMSAPGPYTPEERWGVHTPLLNPANEEVYIFAEKILSEVAALFPFQYVHIGGDEVDPHDWIQNEKIQAFMRSEQLQTPQDLHNYFNQRIARILAKHNRKMIGWDEVLHADLAKGTAVQSWRGPDALGYIAQQGHPAILSSGFYLDQPQSSAYHYRNPVLPAPLSVKQQAAKDENWYSWAFELPRKRGSAIKGSFTLIDNPQTGTRGFIDFAGKSRLALQDIEVRHGVTHFHLDTWMGPLRARLELDEEKLGGDMLVGNTAYPASGSLIGSSKKAKTKIPTAQIAAQLDEDKLHWILGGEAALWSELVDENGIDLRLWPRAFVVAERLWSAQDLRDEDFLYRRLPHIANWAAASVKLQHQKQQLRALKKLLPKNQWEQAHILSEALEPAHYYHRHHEKSAHASYSRKDPLNLFVDTLPVESLPVRRLADSVAQWLQAPQEIERLDEMYNLLARWHSNAEALLQQMETQGDPGNIQQITERVHITSAWGLHLIDTLRNNRRLESATLENARTQLRKAQEMRSEVVVAAAYPVERLLDQL